MKPRFCIYRRANGIYYCEDTETGKQQSLKTRDKTTATRLCNAMNEAKMQPSLSLQIARAYYKAADPNAAIRTWKMVMDEIVNTKTDETLTRWKIAIKDKAMAQILNLPLMETRAEHLLAVLQAGKVSTNVYLRRIHNFAIDMNWLPWPVLLKHRWPKIRFKDKRGIALEEHHKIIAREPNKERSLYYQLLWHTGASQSDMANLKAEDIDWKDRTISFQRQKLRHRNVTPPIIHFGEALGELLRQLPSAGPLFPYLRNVQAKHRTTEFKQRCDGLGIKGVCLHSYRYAWAERAKTAGMPERFAQEMLGHNSKAIHRAYSKKARVKVPSLEEFERRVREGSETIVKTPDVIEPVALSGSDGNIIHLSFNSSQTPGAAVSKPTSLG